MNNAQDTRNWPDLAIGLYDRLTGRGAEITYTFDGVTLQVPSATGAEAAHAEWKVDGTVKVSTRDQG